MKKRDKLIAGLIVGGAIGSVLGLFLKGKDDEQRSKATLDDSNAGLENMIKPKRKGIILRLLDWLEKK